MAEGQGNGFEASGMKRCVVFSLLMSALSNGAAAQHSPLESAQSVPDQAILEQLTTFLIPDAQILQMVFGAVDTSFRQRLERELASQEKEHPGLIDSIVKSVKGDADVRLASWDLRAEIVAELKGKFTPGERRKLAMALQPDIVSLRGILIDFRANDSAQSATARSIGSAGLSAAERQTAINLNSLSSSIDGKRIVTAFLNYQSSLEPRQKSGITAIVKAATATGINSIDTFLKAESLSRQGKPEP